MATVSVVGIALALLLGCFISCKSCSEFVDGSQGFSILFLACVVLAYACLAPYCVEPGSKLICFLRANCVPLAYVLIFSALLSR